MVLLKKSDFKFPVGRVKARKPEGHSGHLRLQAVVGSMEMVMGNPQGLDFFVHFVM